MVYFVLFSSRYRNGENKFQNNEIFADAFHLKLTTFNKKKQSTRTTINSITEYLNVVDACI